MSPLAAKLRAARRFTVDLSAEVGPGRRVHLLRPREEQVMAIWKAGSVTPDDVCAAADGWDGITEADLLGPALGVQDPVPFEADAFAEWARDRVDVLGTLAAALSKAISDHFARRAEAEKN